MIMSIFCCFVERNVLLLSISGLAALNYQKKRIHMRGAVIHGWITYSHLKMATMSYNKFVYIIW